MTITYYNGTFDQNLNKLDLKDDTDSNLAETTIPWIKEGKLRAQFWSIYWSCSSNYKDGKALLKRINSSIKLMCKSELHSYTSFYGHTFFSFTGQKNEYKKTG